MVDWLRGHPLICRALVWAVYNLSQSEVEDWATKQSFSKQMLAKILLLLANSTQDAAVQYLCVPQ